MILISVTHLWVSWDCGRHESSRKPLFSCIWYNITFKFLIKLLCFSPRSQFPIYSFYFASVQQHICNKHLQIKNSQTKWFFLRFFLQKKWLNILPCPDKGGCAWKGFATKEWQHFRYGWQCYIRLALVGTWLTAWQRRSLFREQAHSR